MNNIIIEAGMSSAIIGALTRNSFKPFMHSDSFWEWVETILIAICYIIIGLVIFILVVLTLYATYKLICRIFNGIKNIFVKRKMDESLLFLGLMYEYGDGVEKDLEKAMQCYKKSYELGNVNAYARYMRLKNSLNN